jgi:hypothetical protein
MKMIKFVSSLAFVVMLITAMHPTSAETIERSIIFSDDTGDVYYYEDDEEISYPDLDITNVTCVQTGNRVDLEIELAEGGSFQKTLDISYTVLLVTTSTTVGYILIYSGANSEFAQIWPDAEIGDIIVTDLDLSEPLDIISESIENNILSVSFNLENSYERVLSLYAAAEKSIEMDPLYSDQAPDEYGDEEMGNLEINSGGEYYADAGQTIRLDGNLVEGDSTDYEWIWVFDESLISLEGRNPSHKFSIPGDYSGILYAYDDEGNWGLDYFSVTVNETSSGNGGNGNNQPGFELVIVIGAIAIALVILRRKK